MMKIVKDIVYEQSNNFRLDAYLPASNGFFTIVYFHGGGLESGDKADKNYVEIAPSFRKTMGSFR